MEAEQAKVAAEAERKTAIATMQSVPPPQDNELAPPKAKRPRKESTAPTKRPHKQAKSSEEKETIDARKARLSSDSRVSWSNACGKEDKKSLSAVVEEIIDLLDRCGHHLQLKEALSAIKHEGSMELLRDEMQ